jgi:hypothetical protein
MLYGLDPTMTLLQYRAMVVLSFGGPKRLSELAAERFVAATRSQRKSGMHTRVSWNPVLTPDSVCPSLATPRRFGPLQVIFQGSLAA